MRFRLSFALAGLIIGACKVSTPSGSAYNMVYQFYFEGSERWWRYADDNGSNAILHVEKGEVASTAEGNVITLEHWLLYDDDTEEHVASIHWSSEWDVVRVHGYEIHGTGEEVLFEPPVLVGEGGAHAGDSWTTTTGVHTFTSTVDRVEGCGCPWVPSWDDETCVVLELDDGDNDPATHGLVTGTYHLLSRYGPVWLELDGYDALWKLEDHYWED